MKITEKEVRYVADLGNLKLTDEEVAKFTRDLDEILVHMDKLAEIDTGDIEPMAQVSDVLKTGSQEATAALREDRAIPCLDRQSVMAAAPETDGVFFKVPKVIER